MEKQLIKISNNICHSIKSLSADPTDSLLAMQIIILSLLNAKLEGNMLKSEFDISEIPTKLGLGIQYSAESLENMINNGHLISTIEIRHHNESIRLLKGAICVGTLITAVFNSELYEDIFPKDSYSLFSIHDLLGFRTASGLVLSMVLTAAQNQAGIQSGASFTLSKDFYPLCKLFGLKYSDKSRPGCKILDRFFNKALPDIKMQYPGIKINYHVNRIGTNPRSALRSVSIDVHVSGLKTEGIYGLSPVEIIDNGEPWFKTELGSILNKMIASGEPILFDMDPLGRCKSATTLLTADRIISTSGMKSKRITPLGYDIVKNIKDKDERYRIAKSHVIARRLSGPDSVNNMVVGTVSLNTEMARIESAICKYIQNDPENAIVLYRVEPIYDGESVIPRKIRMGAISIDLSDHNRFAIHSEILNAEHGLLLDRDESIT